MPTFPALQLLMVEERQKGGDALQRASNSAVRAA
jgi:hypothetical protein